MNISFFAKPAFWHGHDRHLMRGSSTIRGFQMAEYLDAKINPKEGYEDDLCIYVKPFTDVKFAKNFYIDVVDGRILLGWLIANPKVRVISCSEHNYKFLKSRLKNKIVLIPQHHCNYDNLRRTRRKVVNVGFIGSPGTFMYRVDRMRNKLSEIGFNFLVKTSYHTREEVVDFYKKIDVQISWRTIQYPFKNPLRLINAASFGIPTVAFPEDCYEEFKDYYIPVKTIPELLNKVKYLRDNPAYYKRFSKKIRKKAREYHISKVAKLYETL